jgi:hypothetical protein
MGMANKAPPAAAIVASTPDFTQIACRRRRAEYFGDRSGEQHGTKQQAT